MWHLWVSVYVQPVILTSQYYGVIIEQCHIEALSVLNFTLQSAQQLSFLPQWKNNNLKSPHSDKYCLLTGCCYFLALPKLKFGSPQCARHLHLESTKKWFVSCEQYPVISGHICIPCINNTHKPIIVSYWFSYISTNMFYTTEGGCLTVRTSALTCVKTVRLKLLWLSAMRTSPTLLMPTPMG